MHQVILLHPPVSQELVSVMDECYKDHFLSRNDWQYKTMMEKLISLNLLLEQRRKDNLPMCQIWYNGLLVGIAWPSVMTDPDTCKACDVAVSEYHRVGRIFILPEYRSMGLGKLAVQRIIEHYGKVVMLCRDYNELSNKVAQRANLENSGLLRGYKRDGAIVPILTDVHNPEESVFVYNIWKN